MERDLPGAFPGWSACAPPKKCARRSLSTGAAASPSQNGHAFSETALRMKPRARRVLLLCIAAARTRNFDVSPLSSPPCRLQKQERAHARTRTRAHASEKRGYGAAGHLQGSPRASARETSLLRAFVPSCDAIFRTQPDRLRSQRNSADFPEGEPRIARMTRMEEAPSGSHPCHP